MRDLKKMFDGYDCGIRYMDDHIRRLFDVLEKQGVLDQTAVIISGDHAENLGELGIYVEHATADHVTCRIPMIIRWPGGKSGIADDKLHYNIDLPPTLMDILGGKKPEVWDGESYAPTVLEGKSAGRGSLVLSQCAHVCQRSVRMGPWLYMRTYHDGYHLFPDEMLFNIEQDPHEQKDVAKQHPELCREASSLLADWHDEMMRTMPTGYSSDPLREVMNEGGPLHARGFLRDYCKRLEATGRGHAVAELKRRHPREFG
jgi:arylsulfatase A-like enzyme